MARLPRFNAAKYAASGGWIGIRTAASASAITIRVEDRGPGVAAEDRPHLFEPFVRGRAAASAVGSVSGAGLGLTLARRALEATGGTVDLREGPGGVGSAFEIRLPLA